MAESIQQLLSILRNDVCNQELNDEKELYNEYEVRFGRFDKRRFDPVLTPKNWQLIFEQWMVKHRINQSIIFDEIYCKPKSPKLIRRLQTCETVVFEKLENFDLDITQSLTRLHQDDAIFMTKERKKTFAVDNLRYSYSVENTIADPKDESRKISLIRLKHRFSRILEEYIQIDMTVVNVYSPNNLTEPQSVEHMIELEIIELNLQDKVDEIMVNLQKAIQNIYYTYFDLKDFMFHKSVKFPRPILKADLILLQQNNYTVTDKANGQRLLLIAFENTIYLQNPHDGKIVKQFANNTDLNYTIVDGEYLQSTNTFAAFDLLLVGKGAQGKKKEWEFFEDVRQYDLFSRLQYLEKLHPQFKKLKSNNLNVILKNFYFENVADKAIVLWENKKQFFDYDLDGLIFTPISNQLNILKWKSQISIDVRVEYVKKLNFTFFHHGSQSATNRVWRTKNDSNDTIKYRRWCTSNADLMKKMHEVGMGIYQTTKKGHSIVYLGKKGKPAINQLIRNKIDVAEYIFNKELKNWQFLRFRTNDKCTPNGYWTIFNNLHCMLNPVALNDILQDE